MGSTSEYLRGFLILFDFACLDKLLFFGFDTLELHRIEGRFIIGNEKSLAVMKKCGMQYEGTARGSMLIKGLYRDIGTAAILRDEFERQVKD